MSEMLSRAKVLNELRRIQLSPYFQQGHRGESAHEMDLYLERLMLMQRIYDTVLTMKPEAVTEEADLDDAV